MQLRVYGPAKLLGEFNPPADKSISHRALLLGAIAEGETVIENCLSAGDVMSTVRCLRQVGVGLNVIGSNMVTVTVHGLDGSNFQKPDEPLDCGNSATTMRMLMGLLAAHNFETILTGDFSLQHRPMDRIAIPLKHMGAKVEGRSESYFPPVRIVGGNLRPITWNFLIASAQAKSAILLAGLFADGVTTVIQPSPTRDHTERMLQSFGAKVITKGLTVSVVGRARLRGQFILIPGDPSASSFFLCASAAIPESQVTALNMNINPTRTAFLEVLQKIGASVTISNLRKQTTEPVADVTVKYNHLKAIQISGDIVPRLIDELPILAVIATAADGVTVIRDASELRVKESDRIKAMVSELHKLGAKIEELPNGMVIYGGAKLKGSELESYGDHRVAMALAIAGVLADGETVVNNAECITNSFPQFHKNLADLGVKVECK